MSHYREEYKETLDYTWVLVRQLDRILAVRSKLHRKKSRYEYEMLLEEYASSLFALYIALPREVRLNIKWPVNIDINNLDRVLSEIIDVLDKKNLLIRKKKIMVGGDVVTGDTI